MHSLLVDWMNDGLSYTTQPPHISTSFHSVIRALKTIIATLYCVCLQYLSCSVNAQGVAFTKAPHCSTPNNLTNPIIICSCMSCASQCSGEPKCLAFSFSQQATTCRMHLSDVTASISTYGCACTGETDTSCKGMYRVRFV